MRARKTLTTAAAAAALTLVLAACSSDDSDTAQPADPAPTTAPADGGTDTTEPTETTVGDPGGPVLDRPLSEVLVRGAVTAGLTVNPSFGVPWEATLTEFVATDTYRNFLLTTFSTPTLIDGYFERWGDPAEPQTQALVGVVAYETPEAATAVYQTIADAVISLGGTTPIPGFESNAVVALPSPVADENGEPTGWNNVSGFALQGRNVYTFIRVGERAGPDAVIGSITSQVTAE